MRLSIVTWVMLLAARLAFAQATSTINGRVLDQGDAVLPGVTVTASNTSTGVARTTVTNREGVYSLPGLEPGIYDVKTDLPGFAPAMRNRVMLAVNTTITLDFKLGLAGVEETVSVTGAAPLIEVTQSKVVASIQATEVENLPMITRNFVGLLSLLPGATPIVGTNGRKRDTGGVSFGGSSGRNVIPTVDGADNRDNQYGGPSITFTTEGLEEFQLATHQFSAADGRSSGAALTMLTKSGTNAVHGSGFVFHRNQALIAKDYFLAQNHQAKPPFKRQQYGGSIGGPIVRNRAFFFAAAEGINEDTSITVPDALYTQMLLLVPFGAKPVHVIPQPFYNAMYTIKTNAQVSNNQSLMGRYAGQKFARDNSGVSSQNDLAIPTVQPQSFWSAVAQHSWVLGSRGLNQLTASGSGNQSHSDVYTSNGQLYTANFPNSPLGPMTLRFPSVSAPNSGGGGTFIETLYQQVRDDVSLQMGTHALRLGANYNRMRGLGILSAQEHFGRLAFFDDPSVIFSNSNGRYPQGIQTPGIVQQWLQGNPVLFDSRVDAEQVMAWFQDDWRATPRLTLNLGVRYDVDFNLFDQRNYTRNATAEVLRAIGNKYGGFPHTPTRDISPRVGLAYDLRGDGRRVLRGGYGLYFDQFYAGARTDVMYQNHRPLGIFGTRTNTAIGVGELATYRYGIDPLPPAPPATNTLPSGSTGTWLDPNLSDPYNHQVHVGYAHELAPGMVVSVDFTHVAGRHDFKGVDINPLVNGVRVLAPALAQVYGDPNLLSATDILASVNKSRYDEMTIQFRRRVPRATIQVHYTLAGAYAYGGVIGGTVGATGPSARAQDSFNIFGPGEWGPTSTDERHRLVAFGVFDLPYNIQFSPVFQAVSARPYTLTAGTDLNRDGLNNDRYVDPATGQQVSVNSQRGDPTTLLDLRVTKFFTVSATRRLGVFAEFFNVFNKANFGQSYNGNARSAVFKQPTGFITGIGYPRQLQLGARFLF